MSGEAVSKEELMPLFEAARWAPSAYNLQPWRFIYALRSSPHWESLYSYLVDFNKQWVNRAGALILILSKISENGSESPTHSFDAGAAWENMALQGHISGLVVHAMSGFDYEAIRSALKISEDFAVEAMIAVGKPGDKELLPSAVREREVPSGRKPLSESVFSIELIEQLV